MEDPGVREQIFMPMHKNGKGLMEVNGDFIMVNSMLECDSTWSEEIHRDFKSYVE